VEGWGLDGPLAYGGGSAAGGSLPSREQLTTFFCCDGSIAQLGPRPNPAHPEGRSRPAGGALPLPDEQGLCIGSVFAISASNGVDAKRSLALRGFCFSAEQLCQRVEDTVLARGGEVFETRRLLKRCGGRGGGGRRGQGGRGGDAAGCSFSSQDNAGRPLCPGAVATQVQAGLLALRQACLPAVAFPPSTLGPCPTSPPPYLPAAACMRCC
jgi:hypothetical protein